MKAIVVREFGGPEVLKLEEVPAPKPGAGQVVVRIKAAGVNPADTYMRSGNYSQKPPLPYTPGTDGAGVIESVGAGVTRVKTGDRVYTARTLNGTYAEYALALDSQVQPLPESISWARPRSMSMCPLRARTASAEAPDPKALRRESISRSSSRRRSWSTLSSPDSASSNPSR